MEPNSSSPEPSGLRTESPFLLQDILDTPLSPKTSDYRAMPESDFLAYLMTLESTQVQAQIQYRLNYLTDNLNDAEKMSNLPFYSVSLCKNLK